MVHICGADLVYCKCPGIDDKLQELLKLDNFVFHNEIVAIVEQREVLAAGNAFLDGLEFGFPNIQN